MTAPQNPPSGLKGKILVVDDELDIREGLYDLLTLEGLRIIYERNLTHPRRRGEPNHAAEESDTHDAVSVMPKRK